MWGSVIIIRWATVSKLAYSLKPVLYTTEFRQHLIKYPGRPHTTSTGTWHDMRRIVFVLLTTVLGFDIWYKWQMYTNYILQQALVQIKTRWGVKKRRKIITSANGGSNAFRSHQTLCLFPLKHLIYTCFLWPIRYRLLSVYLSLPKHQTQSSDSRHHFLLYVEYVVGLDEAVVPL